MACLAYALKAKMEWEFIVHGCDYHHTKSGNIRRGHMFGFALCVWHHRGMRPDGVPPWQMHEVFGPNLMNGGKKFTETYGTDDELITLQTKYIETGYGNLQAA